MKLTAFLIQARASIPGYIPMAETLDFALYTDGRDYFTARRAHNEVLEIHHHTHRDAAVADFHARAGLLKGNHHVR